MPKKCKNALKRILHGTLATIKPNKIFGTKNS